MLGAGIAVLIPCAKALRIKGANIGIASQAPTLRRPLALTNTLLQLR